MPKAPFLCIVSGYRVVVRWRSGRTDVRRLAARWIERHAAEPGVTDPETAAGLEFLASHGTPPPSGGVGSDVLPRLVPVALSRRRRVRALAFIADPGHAQYCHELDLKSRAQLVAQGVGERGRCTDYIRHTLEHMYALGVTDPHLARVLETAEAMRARAVPRRAR